MAPKGLKKHQGQHGTEGVKENIKDSIVPRGSRRVLTNSLFFFIPVLYFVIIFSSSLFCILFFHNFSQLFLFKIYFFIIFSSSLFSKLFFPSSLFCNSYFFFITFFSVLYFVYFFFQHFFSQSFSR